MGFKTNSLVPLNTFDELLSRVNKYAKVEDDEMAIVGTNEARKQRNGGNGNGRFDKSKRKRKVELTKVTKEGYRRVNMVFTKPTRKIMFDI